MSANESRSAAKLAIDMVPTNMKRIAHHLPALVAGIMSPYPIVVIVSVAQYTQSK